MGFDLVTEAEAGLKFKLKHRLPLLGEAWRRRELRVCSPLSLRLLVGIGVSVIRSYFAVGL